MPDSSDTRFTVTAEEAFAMSYSIALSTLNKIMLGEDTDATVDHKIEAAELILGQTIEDANEEDI